MKDPIKFELGDTNIYEYSVGDPANFIDIDGMGRMSVGGVSGYTPRPPPQGGRERFNPSPYRTTPEQRIEQAAESLRADKALRERNRRDFEAGLQELADKIYDNLDKNGPIDLLRGSTNSCPVPPKRTGYERVEVRATRRQ